MFGFFKAPRPTLETLSEALFKLAWNNDTGKKEDEAVKNSGVNPNVFKVEILCLSIFSAVYGYSIWSGRKNLSQEQQEIIMGKFYALIAEQCKTSPKPETLNALISQRIRKYFEVQEADIENTEQGVISMELPRTFVTFLTDSPSNIPYELMLSVSPRISSGVTAVEKILTELQRNI